MNNFYYDLELESVLQCPVCYEIPQKDIFLCKVGHHMCHNCRKKLPSCPTCQAALTNSRNFLAEAIICRFALFKVEESQTTTNNNHSDVSLIDSPSTTIELNSNNLRPLPLPPGIYQCLLESCRTRKNKMGTGKLISHVEKVHRHLFEKFKNNTATFTEVFKDFFFMGAKNKYHRAFHITNMGLFFLNLKILEDSYINCWISTPAPSKLANKFSYHIKFCKEEGNINLAFTNKMATNCQSSNWLLKRGRVFVIPPTSHQLKTADFFSLHVKIVYKPPNLELIVE